MRLRNLMSDVDVGEYAGYPFPSTRHLPSHYKWDQTVISSNMNTEYTAPGYAFPYQLYIFAASNFTPASPFTSHTRSIPAFPYQSTLRPRWVYTSYVWL